MVSALSAGLLASPGQASAAKPLVLEQTSVSVSLGLTSSDGRTHLYRLHLLPLSETVRLESGRQIHLETNAGVPAGLDGPRGKCDALLNFAAVSSHADVSGKVFLTRKVSLTGCNFEADLSLQMELDLLSLGNEKPQITVRSAHFVALQGAGQWKDFELAKTAYLAMPAAPLTWSMSPTQLDIDAHSQEFSGEWHLASPLSPEAFVDREQAWVVLNAYSLSNEVVETIHLRLRVEQDAEGLLAWHQSDRLPSLESFRIHWIKSAQSYAGRISGRLLTSDTTQIRRISVRFGSTNTPFQTQLIGFLAQKQL